GEMARRGALAFGIVSLAEEKTAAGIGDGVAALVVAVRSGAAERGQGNDDQAGKLFTEAAVVEGEFFQIPEGRRLEQQIRRGQQPSENFALGLALEVERDAALVGVGVDEREAALGML